MDMLVHRGVLISACALRDGLLAFSVHYRCHHRSMARLAGASSYDLAAAADYPIGADDVPIYCRLPPSSR